MHLPLIHQSTPHNCQKEFAYDFLICFHAHTDSVARKMRPPTALIDGRVVSAKNYSHYNAFRAHVDKKQFLLLSKIITCGRKQSAHA